jgi:dTDP-4-amino-4,6-dideoxygalactose transaminase
MNANGNEYKSSSQRSPLAMTDRIQPANESAGISAESPVDDDPLVGGVGSFYPWPLPDDAVHVALGSCYADGSWGRYHGPHTSQLRTRLAGMHAVEHVQLCSSGTIAVELALRGLKVAAEHEVILAGYDFAGNFRAIEAIGARPVLVDIDPCTWCLDATHLAEAIGPQTRAIIVSHLHGGLADMPTVKALASAHGIGVVEDACQAPGAMLDGRMAGTWGDVGVLSFGGSKLLTAGRGGALLTRHADIHQRIKIYTDRGNEAFPLSELQAAVLSPQLDSLAERNRLRRQRVDRILAATANYPILRPVQVHPHAQPSFYKLAWLLQDKQSESLGSRVRFIAVAQAERIPVDAGFRGFASRSARRCRIAGDLTHSAAAARQTVVLHHPVLLAENDEVDRMIQRFVGVLDRMCGNAGKR